MLSMLVLASALVVDDDGCRWLRHDVRVVPKHAIAASAPIHIGKTRKLHVLPGYDPLDCGKGGSALPPLAIETFTPIPKVEPEEPVAVPASFNEMKDQVIGNQDVTGTAPYTYNMPSYVGGGYVITRVITSPIPEPATWLMMVCCLAFMMFKQNVRRMK